MSNTVTELARVSLRNICLIGFAFTCVLCSRLAGALSCADYSSYRVENNLVYYHRNGGNRLLSGIDVPTFQAITQEDPLRSCRAGYAKDARAVLYEGDRIDGALADSFQLFQGWGGYARDRQRVYAEGRAISNTPDKFQVFGNIYATDGSTVFVALGACQEKS